MRNGRKPDAATPRGGRRPSGRKPLSEAKKEWRVNSPSFRLASEEGPANFVPAAAVIRRARVLFGFTGRKGRLGGRVSWV